MATYQIVARILWRNVECRNVFYYTTTSELDTAQLQEAADEVRAAYVNLDANDLIGDGWSLYGIDARRVDVADLPAGLFTFTLGAFTGGDNVAKELPSQVAMVVSGYAPTQSPRRARSYLCGFTVDAWADGGGFTTQAIADAAVWVAAMDQLTVTGDTLNRVAAEWDPATDTVVATNRLTAYQVRGNPGTQRKRRIGSGI